MVMNIIKKLFCLHKWITHAKKEYKWTETEVVYGTEHWYTPLTEVQEKEVTDEVLICTECGKIKKISY